MIRIEKTITSLHKYQKAHSVHMQIVIAREREREREKRENEFENERN